MTHAVYLDTNVLISLFEGDGPSHHALWLLVNESASGLPVEFRTSALSFAELLVKPYRDRNHGLARQYMMLARSEDWLKVLPVRSEIIELSAVIRARFRLRLPDALHLATAVACRCEYFLTFDLGITDLMDLDHPISDHALKTSIQVIRPDPASLSELIKAISP